MSAFPALKQRLSQLALAVAALAAIATSPAATLGIGQEGSPITLDSARSIEVRRFAVRLDATVEDLPSDRSDINGRVSVSITVHHAADETPPPIHRIVRASFKRLDVPSSQEKTITTADSTSEGLLSTSAFASCSDRRCDGEFELVLELLDPAAGAPVVVNWSVGVGTDLSPSDGSLALVLDR